MRQREREARARKTHGPDRPDLDPPLAGLSLAHPGRDQLRGPEVLRPRWHRLGGDQGVGGDRTSRRGARCGAAAPSPSSSPRTSTSAPRRASPAKLREAIVTRWLEDDLSKVRILTLYLNVIEWGDGIYGCEAAAQAWFGKACADLDVEEAAGLAGMIPNPRRINPRVNPGRYERASGACSGSWPTPATSRRASPASAPLLPSPSPRPKRKSRPAREPPAGRAARASGTIFVVNDTKNLTVGDVMTADPLTLEPEESLMRALEIMRLRGIRRIPVVLAGMLVGLLAEGDLKRAEPSTLSESQEDFNRVMEETQISRIMIQNPVTTTARHAAARGGQAPLRHEVRRPACGGRRARGGHPHRQRPHRRPRPRARRPERSPGRGARDPPDAHAAAQVSNRRVRAPRDPSQARGRVRDGMIASWPPPRRGRRCRDLVRGLRPSLRGPGGAVVSRRADRDDPRPPRAVASGDRGGRGGRSRPARRAPRRSRPRGDGGRERSLLRRARARPRGGGTGPLRGGRPAPPALSGSDRSTSRCPTACCPT